MSPIFLFHNQSPLALVEAAKAYIDERKPTDFEAAKPFMADVTRRLDNSEEVDLTQITKVLSRLFFCDALHDVSCCWADRPSDDPTSLAVTTSSSRDRNVKITIYKDIYAKARSNSNLYGLSRSEIVIGTLLHECVHAFIRKLACNGRCNSRDCELVFVNEAGEYCHGDAFHKLAAKVENWMSVKFNKDFDMGRNDAANAYFQEEDAELSEDTKLECFPCKELRVVDYEGYQKLVIEDQ